MKIGDVMNSNVTMINKNATLKEAAITVSKSQASDLMVVDDQSNFIGVLSEGDLIRAALPEYNELIKDGVSLGNAWTVFLDKGKELAQKPITSLIG